jgi:hypothetical protein
MSIQRPNNAEVHPVKKSLFCVFCLQQWLLLHQNKIGTKKSSARPSSGEGKNCHKNFLYVRRRKIDHDQAKKIDKIACETAKEKRVIWHARTTQTRKSDMRYDLSPVNAEEVATVTSGIGTAAMERFFSMSERMDGPHFLCTARRRAFFLMRARSDSILGSLIEKSSCFFLKVQP